MTRKRERARVQTTIAAIVVCGLAVLVLAAVPAAILADELHYDIKFGMQGLSIEEARNARAQLYRDIPGDAFAASFGLHWLDFGKGWSLGVTGKNVLRLDQRYNVSLDKPGLLKLKGSWRETPHFFSNDATWLLTGRPGNYTFSNTLRQVLESISTSTVPDSLARTMPEVLARTARHVDLRLQRRRAAGTAGVRVAQGLELEVTAAHEKREGERPIGTGTYIRRQAVEAGTGAGFFDRERFEPRGIELPEPIRHRVQEYGASVSFRRKRGHLTAGWQSSFFRNHVGALLWDNPFEASPSVASSSDRNRFAQGGLDLAPENDFNRIHASGGLVLPRKTRLTAGVSVGMMKQDDPFMAFTRNEAIMFPGPDGTGGTPDDIPGTSLGLLPATSLDGEIRTTRIDARLSSRPLPKLALRADFRNYKYEDRTAELEFPGYAAAGESYFRRGIGQTRGTTQVLFNEVGGYERRVLSGALGYQFVKQAGADVEFAATTWDYDTRQVESTTENAFRGTLRLQPVAGMAARVGYLNAQRDFDGEYEIGLETSGVRAFDIWDRDRQRIDGSIDWEPDDRWSIGVTFADWKDEFPGTVAAASLPAANVGGAHPYGLDEATTTGASATVGYHEDRWNLSVSYGRDTSEWTSLAVTKTTLANDADLFAANNRWERKQDDTTDWASLGVTVKLVPDKLQLLADLGWSHYEGDFETTNPETPDINSAVAYDLPAFESDFLSGKVGLKWSLRQNLDVSARYWVEPYRLDDWQWDNVRPYMQGVVKETAGSPTTFRNENVQRLLLLDNRYSDYTIHAFAVALATRF
jgi:MtrB/PioB family decaheme-associated outer membrane protein